MAHKKKAAEIDVSNGDMVCAVCGRPATYVEGDEKVLCAEHKAAAEAEATEAKGMKEGAAKTEETAKTEGTQKAEDKDKE